MIYQYIEKNKKFLLYFPLVIYWFILFIAVSIPGHSVPSSGISDKFEHFFAFLFLGILFSLTLTFQNKFFIMKRNPLLFTLLLLTIYGVLSELLQSIIPGRLCSIYDMISNFSGIMTAILLVYFFKNKYLSVTIN